MPIYEYYCESCKEKFDHLARSMNQSGAKVACPKCNSKKTTRDFSTFATKASSPSSSEAHACGGGGGCCGGACHGH